LATETETANRSAQAALLNTNSRIIIITAQGFIFNYALSQIFSRLSFQRDLCKTPLFAKFLRQAQNLILEILNVFLWLKLSPFLNLNNN
jgi:hypothetical protein